MNPPPLHLPILPIGGFGGFVGSVSPNAREVAMLINNRRGRVCDGRGVRRHFAAVEWEQTPKPTKPTSGTAAALALTTGTEGARCRPDAASSGAEHDTWT